MICLEVIIIVSDPEPLRSVIIWNKGSGSSNFTRKTWKSLQNNDLKVGNFVKKTKFLKYTNTVEPFCVKGKKPIFSVQSSVQGNDPNNKS